MSSQSLSRLMRLAVISVALCLLFLCLYIIPLWGRGMIDTYPELSAWYWPWLMFAWITALPCFMVLGLIWKVSRAVKEETVFTMVTAQWVKRAAVWLLSDAVLLVAGNIILLLLNMNHPGILILSMILAICIVGMALLAGVLSRYLTKATVMQEESDGTL